MRAALRRIAWFYSRNFADRRTDREKGVLARARVELFKRPYRAKREGKSPVSRRGIVRSLRRETA